VTQGPEHLQRGQARTAKRPSGQAHAPTPHHTQREAAPHTPHLTLHHTSAHTAPHLTSHTEAAPHTPHLTLCHTSPHTQREAPPHTPHLTLRHTSPHTAPHLTSQREAASTLERQGGAFRETQTWRGREAAPSNWPSPRSHTLPCHTEW